MNPKYGSTVVLVRSQCWGRGCHPDVSLDVSHWYGNVMTNPCGPVSLQLLRKPKDLFSHIWAHRCGQRDSRVTNWRAGFLLEKTWMQSVVSWGQGLCWDLESEQDHSARGYRQGTSWSLRCWFPGILKCIGATPQILHSNGEWFCWWLED